MIQQRAQDDLITLMTLLTTVKHAETHWSGSAAALLDSHCGTENLPCSNNFIPLDLDLCNFYRKETFGLKANTKSAVPQTEGKSALHVGNQSSVTFPAITMIQAFSGLPKSY
jgi:hypothetical protein